MVIIADVQIKLVAVVAHGQAQLDVRAIGPGKHAGSGQGQKHEKYSRLLGHGKPPKKIKSTTAYSLSFILPRTRSRALRAGSKSGFCSKDRPNSLSASSYSKRFSQIRPRLKCGNQGLS